MGIKTYLSYVLYRYVAVHLPEAQRPGSPIRCFRYLCLRGYADSVGKSVNVQNRATVGRRVTIGDYSGIGRDCLVQSGTTIGKHVMMGPEVLIFTQNHSHASIEETLDTQGFEPEEPVTIEDDVWIGARAIILPGVTIGRGSIIGAGAIVTKDVPPYSIAAGNPARVVKTRV